MNQKPIIVIHGDEIVKADLKSMYKQHVTLKSPVTACVADNKEILSKIYLTFDKDSKRICRLGFYLEDTPIEKAKRDGFSHSIIGFWILQPETIGMLVSSTDSPEFLRRCFENGDLYAYPTGNFFLNINSLDQVKTARNKFAR